MAAPLTALGRKAANPAPHVCAACGSTRDACRGYPNDVWYCAPRVPPKLRFPWELGCAAPAVVVAPELPAIAVRPAPADLLSGLTPS